MYIIKHKNSAAKRKERKKKADVLARLK